MITKEQYAEICDRLARHDAWVDTKRGKNGWASYHPSEKPADVPDVTNEERSAVEVYEFVNQIPDRYFLYVNEEKQTATTWTGDTLGRVLFGREHRSCFGDKRVPVTVLAINGRKYHGTYYKSAGDYARVRLAK